ncbi:unnamed protein product [Soboliphyme baturini]|uniref:ZP domain-containing protein n=1 Tax=Soboliphyme baturini TaxID=241478 RepID=A0A183INE6_9BILA|nr:unnamed protein product [Soboliphyme baturini]
MICLAAQKSHDEEDSVIALITWGFFFPLLLFTVYKIGENAKWGVIRRVKSILKDMSEKAKPYTESRGSEEWSASEITGSKEKSVGSDVQITQRTTSTESRTSGSSSDEEANIVKEKRSSVIIRKPSTSLSNALESLENGRPVLFKLSVSHTKMPHRKVKKVTKEGYSGAHDLKSSETIDAESKLKQKVTSQPLKSLQGKGTKKRLHVKEDMQLATGNSAAALDLRKKQKLAAPSLASAEGAKREDRMPGGEQTSSMAAAGHSSVASRQEELTKQRKQALQSSASSSKDSKTTESAESSITSAKLASSVGSRQLDSSSSDASITGRRSPISDSSISTSKTSQEKGKVCAAVFSDEIKSMSMDNSASNAHGLRTRRTLETGKTMAETVGLMESEMGSCLSQMIIIAAVVSSAFCSYECFTVEGNVQCGKDMSKVSNVTVEMMDKDIPLLHHFDEKMGAVKTDQRGYFIINGCGADIDTRLYTNRPDPYLKIFHYCTRPEGETLVTFPSIRPGNSINHVGTIVLDERPTIVKW